VGAPIIAQGRTVGFINLDSATPAFYQPVHGERLRAFANLAAIAIHNAGLYERAQQQAATDELTGLYNRRGLMSVGQIEVERSLRYVRPLTVLMADVDNFKQVNDRSGYRAGDEVLHMLAKRCRQCLRSIDIAGRYGGDEFVFVLPESTMEGAIKVAERLRFSVDSDLFATTAEPLRISISIGAAVLTPPQSSFAQLLEQAGAALHAAKFAGKNRVAG
jgi:diguanylate cyclase (GGDEF)-like protein